MKMGGKKKRDEWKDRGVRKNGGRNDGEGKKKRRRGRRVIESGGEKL